MMTDPRQGVQTYGSVIHRRRMSLFISVSLSRTTAHSTGGQAEDTVISQACKLNEARWDLSDALAKDETTIPLYVENYTTNDSLNQHALFPKETRLPQ